MSGFGQVSFKEVVPQRHEGSNQVYSTGSQNVIQDQIIVAPEIMKKILGELDLRNIKKVRHVCKSWLGEAQAHMETRGIVVLNESSGSSGRVDNFIKMKETKISALPQPFKSIDVRLEQDGSIIFKKLITQIGTLDSTLMIERLSLEEIPLKLAISILTQHSCTLKYVFLSFPHTKEGNNPIPSLDSKQAFPNLRHLSVDTERRPNSVNTQVQAFVSLVTDLVKASPNLETYENSNASWNAGELASTLLMAVDVGNVKTLKISCGLSSEAVQHLTSISFRQLQNFKLMTPTHSHLPLNPLTAILEKSAATLKTLNFRLYSLPDKLAEFPICPCVQELSLDLFQYSISTSFWKRFPSLQVLNVNSVENLEGSWTNLPVFSGLKTLRVKKEVQYRDVGDLDKFIVSFFKMFPSLERVRLDYSFVMRICKKIAARDPGVSNQWGSVKHLELTGIDGFGRGTNAEKDYYSSYASLRGIETLSLVEYNLNICHFPLEAIGSLKAIYFPWGLYLDKKHLLANTRRLKKVFITNCCSISRTETPLTCKALTSFFDSAPNAECGCKEWKEKSSPEWSYN